MSQPLRPGDETELLVPGNNPPDNPNDKPTTYAMMLATNTGIGIFGGAGIFFCLHDLLQAFLVALLIVIALAIGNIVLLLVLLRPYCGYPAAAGAAAKTRAGLGGGDGGTGRKTLL